MVNPIIIKNANHTFGAPEGWDAEKHGDCEPLQVVVEVVEGQMRIWSAWQPDEQERAAIAAGHPVILCVIGSSIPPMMVAVAADSYGEGQ